MKEGVAAVTVSCSGTQRQPGLNTAAWNAFLVRPRASGGLEGRVDWTCEGLGWFS